MVSNACEVSDKFFLFFEAEKRIRLTISTSLVTLGDARIPIISCVCFLARASFQTITSPYFLVHVRALHNRESAPHLIYTLLASNDFNSS